jgi:hypothetical protein
MEVPIQSLSDKMHEIIADRERSYRGQFSSHEKRVLRLVGSVERAARNLREAIGRAWGTLTKPAEQHGIRLTEQVLDACRSLAASKSHVSYDELRKFQESSVQTIRTIVKTYNKYVPSIIRAVKSESSALEDSITALSQSVTELGQVLESSNLRELHFMVDDADRLVQNARELNLKTNEIQQMKETSMRLQVQEERLRNDLSSLSHDQAIKELNHIEEEARQREAEILALLEPLLKPLRKIDRANEKAQEGLSRAIVSKIVENPLGAVLETSAGEMRDLLISLHQLLERDELLLDQRRKRKAADAIQALQAGRLDRFKEDLGILEANKREVLRLLKGSGLYDQWLSVHSQSNDIRTEITQCKNHIAELESQEARLRASLLGDKERVESALRKILNQQVSIHI